MSAFPHLPAQSYPQYDRQDYIPAVPSPRTGIHAFAPGAYHAMAGRIVLLRDAYQPDTYTGRIAAPTIQRSKAGFRTQWRKSRDFGNDTWQYANLQAPRPTWNGLPPGQRAVAVILRGSNASVASQQDVR